jgi:hypothetical protein
MRIFAIACPAACVAALTCTTTAFCATTVVIKNAGRETVQLGFDQGAPQKIGSHETATFALNAGPHTAQCRFDGAYDGCNIEQQFTLADRQRVNLELQPVYTLQHAVTLAGQGALKVQTRRDAVWATKAQDLTGAGGECASYESGKLASISTKIASGMPVDGLALATQQLCGEARPVISTTIGGEKMFVQPDFLIFRDGAGHPILVRP